MMQNNRQRKPGISLVRGILRFLLALGTIFGSLYLGLLGLTVLMRLKTVNDWVHRLNQKINTLSCKTAGTRVGKFSGSRVGSMYFSIGEVKHVGRKSGREYVTVLSAYPLGDGFVFALAYGPKVDWYRNIMASGTCTLTWKGQVYELERPEIIPLSEALAAYPLLVRPFVRAGGMKQFLWLHKQSAGPEQERVLVGE